MQVGVNGCYITLVEKDIRERKRDMAVACINITMAGSLPCQAKEIKRWSQVTMQITKTWC
jgi:hypothetical protein